MDASLLLEKSKKGDKQLKFAVSNAIRDTLKRISAVEKLNARKQLVLRKEFVETLVGFIREYPSVAQGRYYGIIGIGSSRAKSRLLLGLLVEGGEKTSGSGAGKIAIPITGELARQSFTDEVATKLYIKRLMAGQRRSRYWNAAKPATPKKLREYQNRSRSKNPRKGLVGQGPFRGPERSFLIPGRGLFIRVSKGSWKVGIRFLYDFESKAKMRKKLDWYGVALRVSDATYAKLVQENIREALEHAGLT